MKPELTAHQQLLRQAINSPAIAASYSTDDWELLLRLASQVKMLGVLAAELERLNLLAAIPIRAADQLRASLIEVRNVQQLARWELNRMRRALKGRSIPVIVLKGLAYLLAGLPSAEGRYFVDLDILVPSQDLNEFEALLRASGWRSRAMSAYDEHYYRAWGHEIPPLKHPDRRTEIDVHHALAPVTGRLQTDVRALFVSAIPAPGCDYQILCPIDMVLQCAVNLFQNNELSDDLRDLFDLHAALQLFANDVPDFWVRLVQRSNELKLGRPLFYGLQFSRQIFDTAVPPNVELELKQRPAAPAIWAMQRLVPQALFPLHPDKPAAAARWARRILFMRSHWLRMPPHLLLLHFTRKAYALIFLRSGGAPGNR